MIIKKITTGFVVQTFDTKEKRYLSQEFIAGEVDYETMKGEPVTNTGMLNDDGSEPYLPFTMLQPGFI